MSPNSQTNKKSSASRKKMALYARVSTQEQAQDGVSLDVQRDKIRTYCKSHGIRLIDIKADHGISGGTMDRPALQARLLRLIEVTRIG